uniref:CSON001287 protein n=1 Tax=Culicoides sonorensis TaxID=179676 RepID=A0A336MKD2_CULSO
MKEKLKDLIESDEQKMMMVCYNQNFHDHVREFTCGKMYYRTFYLDEKRDALYVGAIEKINVQGHMITCIQ